MTSEDAADELRRRIASYEQMLAQLRRDDDVALRALAEELERQLAATRAKLATLGPPTHPPA